MPGALSFAVLKTAVKQIMQTVAGIGTVETRVGGMRGWNSRPGETAPFWEISVVGVLEEGCGTGPQAFERARIQIEGFLPHSYGDNSDATWDALLLAVRDALRQYYPALHGLGATGVRGSGLPQLLSNRVHPYESDHQVNPAARNTKLVHHAVLELVAERHFVYQLATTLP
jgi:hypothetical protein